MNYKDVFGATAFDKGSAPKLLLLATGLLVLWVALGGLLTPEASSGDRVIYQSQAAPPAADSLTADTLAAGLPEPGPLGSGREARLPAEGPAPGWGWMTTVLLLGGAIMLVAYLYRNQNPLTTKSDSTLERVSSLSLGNGQKLHLVRCGSEIHLVGATEHQISALKTYDEHELEANLPPGDADHARITSFPPRANP